MRKMLGDTMNPLKSIFQKKEESQKTDSEKEYEMQLVKQIYERIHPKLRGELKEETVIGYLQAIEISMIHTNHLMGKMSNIIEYQQNILQTELGNQAVDVSSYWDNIYKV